MTKGEEVPLEDIDKLISQEDPEFAQTLEEVRNVEVDTNVVIEASAIDESEEPAAEPPEKQGIVARTIHRVRQSLVNFRVALRLRLIQLGKDILIFLKTQPKEFARYLWAKLKYLGRQSLVPIVAFMQASRLQQLSILVLIAMLAGVIWTFRANLQGIWIPHLTKPILTSLENHADLVERFDPKDGAESFYSAFPQERHEFLFEKFRVNLKRTEENPWPMGAFEVIVEVDSKDTAVEVRDREVEFHDLIQRIFEEETYNDLASDLGKARLKSRIKRELNQHLTQGWTKEVNFRTFILKP